MKKLIAALLLSLTLCGIAYGDSTTTRLGITKPSIGSSGWGTKVNSDCDLMDSGFAVMAASNTFTSTNVFTGGALIGINTTTPQNKLDVNGAVAIGSYGGANAAPSNGLIVSGPVGIGTNTVQALLDIRGVGVAGSTNTVQISTSSTGSPAVLTISTTGVPGFGANLTMNSNKITSLGAATTNGDAVRYEQVLGSKHFGMSNLVITRPGVSSCTVTADYLEVEDVWVTNLSTSADITKSGAGGLDTGSAAASTWYFIWGIYNPTSNTFGVLLSTSPTGPTMPSGYTKKRRMDMEYRDSSGNFLDFRTFNNHHEWYVDLDSSVYATLYNATPTTGAWTDLTMSSVTAPALECIVRVSLSATNTGGVLGGLREKGSAGGNGTVGSNIPGVRTWGVASSSANPSSTTLIKQNSTRVIQYFFNTSTTGVYINTLGFEVPPA